MGSRLKSEPRIRCTWGGAKNENGGQKAAVWTLDEGCGLLGRRSRLFDALPGQAGAAEVTVVGR